MKAKVATGGHICKPITKTHVKEPRRGKLDPDFQPIYWAFSNRKQNPDYQAGLIPLAKVRPKKAPNRPPALRACLLHNNAESSQRVFPDTLLVKTRPKWNTELRCVGYDPDTGEIKDKPHHTDDLKAGNHRKIQSLVRFCDYYQPMYEGRGVSLLMHTFTEAQNSRTTMRRLLDTLKHRYKALGYEIRGYWWSMEISDPKPGKRGYHFHYLLVIATNHMNLRGKGIPDPLKLDDLWGMGTKVEFVRKNIRSYLSSYFAKNNWRITDPGGSVFRMYGTSRKYL